MAELASQPCLALDARDLAALGITGEGEEGAGEGGASCMWLMADQNVSLLVDLPLSYAHLVNATAIPEPGAPQEGACPAAAAVAAAALTHIQ